MNVDGKTRHKYTLGFIYCEETRQVLLLNRNKLPWMGKWNGVGGKLDQEETAYQCIIRETEEETGLLLPQYEARGVLLWEVTHGAKNSNDDNANSKTEIGGLYLFTANISKIELESYTTPKSFPEGILHWKSLDWMLDENNLGIVDNIKLLFKNNTILKANKTDLFTVKYHNFHLNEFIHSKVDYYPE